MENQYKAVVEEASEMEKKWNFLTPIFFIPLLIIMFVFAGIYLPMIGKMISQSGETLSISVTKIEYYIELPKNIWLMISLGTWCLYFWGFLEVRNNKIFAYILNNYASALIFFPTYYSIFYGFQFFVPFLVVRVFYWVLFIGSLIYILRIAITKRISNSPILTRVKTRQFTNIILMLWGINSVANLFIGGFNHFVARLLFAATPIFPPLLILAFTHIYIQLFSKLFILNDINHNQEKYRQEFGYSLEDWYGKKSQEYLESIGQTAIPIWKTVRFRLITELVISMGLFLLIGSVHKNSDSPPLWVMLSLGFSFIVFPLDCLISLVKWLRKKFRK